MRSLGKKIRGVFEAAAIVAPCPRADQQLLGVGHHTPSPSCRTGISARARLLPANAPGTLYALFTAKAQAPRYWLSKIIGGANAPMDEHRRQENGQTSGSAAIHRVCFKATITNIFYAKEDAYVPPSQNQACSKLLRSETSLDLSRLSTMRA